VVEQHFDVERATRHWKDDQAKAILANVEHQPSIDEISVRDFRAHVTETRPLRGLGDAVPVQRIGFHIGNLAFQKSYEAVLRELGTE